MMNFLRGLLGLLGLVSISVSGLIIEDYRVLPVGIHEIGSMFCGTGPFQINISVTSSNGSLDFLFLDSFDYSLYQEGRSYGIYTKFSFHTVEEMHEYIKGYVAQDQYHFLLRNRNMYQSNKVSYLVNTTCTIPVPGFDVSKTLQHQYHHGYEL